jgi:hypothetical protein
VMRRIEKGSAQNLFKDNFFLPRIGWVAGKT